MRKHKYLNFSDIKKHARELRADFKGLNYFIADFYCNEKKAVIELDGPIHLNTEEYDQFRDCEMQQIGIHVLRLKNEDLVNMDAVLQIIYDFLNQIP